MFHKLLAGLGATLILSLGVPALAFAATADQARQALIQARLNPRPLYPDLLPLPLDNEVTAIFKPAPAGGFSLRYTIPCDDASGYLCVIVDFDRGPGSDLGKLIDFSQNVQRHPVNRVRVAGRVRYQFNMDTQFGYAWSQQGRTYSVLAHVPYGSPQFSWADLGRFLGSMEPLGHEWVGHTSQGHLVSLYVSHSGLDYDVRWSGGCSDGSNLGLVYTEAFPLVHLDRRGGFDQGGRYQDNVGDRLYSDLTGQITGAHAQGTFVGSGDFTASGGDSSCDSGQVRWSARRL